MQKISIEALARQQLHAAISADGGRAADTVYGGHEKTLRQTVIGVLKGTQLDAINNHDDITVYVISGRVKMFVGEDSWEGRSGDLLIVPPGRHSFEALEDAALLMSVGKGRYPNSKAAQTAQCEETAQA